MKNKFKKVSRYVVWGGVLGVTLLVALEGGLRLVSRTQWFQTRVTHALQQALGREFSVSNMGLSLRGMFVENFAMAQAKGATQEPFIEAEQLWVRFSLWHLLHGHVKVNLILLTNAHVRVTRYADGTTSWDDLVTQEDVNTEPPAASGPLSFKITADHVRWEQLHLLYRDETMDRELEVDGVTIDVKNFDLAEPFPLTLTAILTQRQGTQTLRAPLVLRAQVDLHQLDWARASVTLEKLRVMCGDASLALNGSIENFQAPQFNATIKVTQLTSDLFPPSFNVPEFSLPQAEVTLKADVNLAKQSVTLHQFNGEAPGITWQGSGGLVYAAPLRYDATLQTTLLLGEVGRWFKRLADPYQLIGTVEAAAHLTQEQVTADVKLTEVGGALIPENRLSDVQATLTWKESMDFKTGSAHVKGAGKLNGNPFTLEANAKQTVKEIAVNVTANTPRLVIHSLPQGPDTPAAKQPAKPASAWPLPPLHVKAMLQIEQAEIPYFYGEKIVFTSDLAGITPRLDQAHGTLHLVTAKGKIQDVYKLTNANPITKVLFLSLNVTGKVFNSLNVLGVLRSLGGGISAAVTGGEKEKPVPMRTQTILGPDGQPLEVQVPENTQEIAGEMAYDKFDTEVNFVRGLATIKEGTFVSETMSMRLDGTADFNSNALDLTVRAAPGRHEVDGMMPLTLKIGGTIDDPKGDMQMLGSVASLVTQSVTNNVVSRQVTKGFKGIFGLFKKKEVPAQPAASNEVTSQGTAQ